MRSIIPFVLVALFVAAGALASPKGPIKIKHKGLKGLDDLPVNCGYCHAKDKAANPKKKGSDLAALKKGKYCAIKGCH